ncbi:centrosomal protein of 170 kDa isoform X2 [Electrophorus electricus]|uniref:centrosomal protein of 170 kDa isoform X2 n=1 Tax=Electrophorus electricus TaxID=8005 RepID=UPI0015D03E3B|nr:centrosomal protein of 170 kDa isoform X2 [Electrophorus electricus]
MSLTSWFLVSDGGTRHRLPREMIFVGRDDCELMLQSRSVDKQHAVINYEAASDEHKVKDLGSLNGTFVNDVRIQEQQYVTLKIDDKLRFGYDTNLFTVMQGELHVPEEALRHEKFSSQLQLTVKASSTVKSTRNSETTAAESGKEGMVKPPKQLPKQEDKIGDIGVVPRGTPLYGQPSWWGDVDDENAAKHDAKTLDRRQFKCDPGNKDVVKTQIVPGTMAQNSTVQEPSYFEIPSKEAISAGMGINDSLPTTEEGATVTSTAPVPEGSTHGHASFTIDFDTVAASRGKDRSTKDDQDHHVRPKRGAGEELSALQSAMIAAEVKVADWLAQNELPLALSESVAEDDGDSVKSDVPVQLRNLRGSKHEDGTQSDSENAFSEQLSSRRAIIPDIGRTGVHKTEGNFCRKEDHFQNKPFVTLKKMPPVGGEVGQRRNYPSPCRSRAIPSQRGNDRTRESSHRSQADDQSDRGTYTIELENCNTEKEKARLMIDKVFGVEDTNLALTKLRYTEHQRDSGSICPRAGAIDSRHLGQVLPDDLVVVGGPRWVSQWASLAASHIRTDPEGSGAESTMFATDEKGNNTEPRVPRRSNSFVSSCQSQPKKTHPKVPSENSEMDTVTTEEEWSQHRNITPSSETQAQELQGKDNQLHEMCRTRQRVARVNASTGGTRVNKQTTTKGHERGHNICQQIPYTRTGSGEKNHENESGKSRREEKEKSAKPLLRQESFTVERSNANIPLELIPCIDDPHTTSQGKQIGSINEDILLKDSEAVTVFLENTLSDLADPASYSLEGSVSPESDIDTTSTVSQAGGEVGCKKKVSRPIHGTANKNTSDTKLRSHTCAPTHSQSRAWTSLDLTDDDLNASLKDPQPRCWGQTRLRTETSSRTKGAKTRTAAAAFSSSRPASLPQPRPTRASLLRRARLGDSTDPDLADIDRVSVASEASTASSASRPSANRRTLSRIEALAQPRKPRVSSPSARSDSEATSRRTRVLVSRPGSDSALRLGLQSTAVSGLRGRTNSTSKLPDKSAGNLYVHKTPTAGGRWRRVPIEYVSTSEDEFGSNHHSTKNTRSRLMAPCATQLGGSAPALQNAGGISLPIQQSNREQDDYMKDWTAHSEEIARISQDLAKDLAMLAQEIHDVAGEIDSVSPSSAPSVLVEDRVFIDGVGTAQDSSSKVVEMRSCRTSNQQPPAIRRRTWNRDEAVLDNLLLVSVSQLSAKIRQGVEKTVSKIRILFKDKDKKCEELENKLQAEIEVPLLKTSNQEISSILQDLKRVERQLLVIDIMVDPDGTLDALSSLGITSPVTTENRVSPSTQSPTGVHQSGEGSASAQLLHSVPSKGTEQDLDIYEVKNRALQGKND